MNAELKIRFPDASRSFVYGVEYGRLLAKIERGDDVVMNNGFPIRLENVSIMKQTCNAFGYIPVFGKIWYDEWVEFVALKKVSTDS